MSRAVPHDPDAFLASLRERHRRTLPRDRPYEEMMYHARDPPTPRALADILRYSDEEDPDPDTPQPPVPDDPTTLEALARVARTMQWPDPAPLAAAADHLPGWDTLRTTTYLHTMIPDYPIWGPIESAGLARLGHDIPYDPRPHHAIAGYGAYIDAIKQLREAARFEHVPESHHYLTRIVQTALREVGAT